MATDKTQTLSTLRTKVLTDSLNNRGANRFGLFSYPPAGVWGNGDYNFNKSKTLGQDGKPVTKPRGLYAGPPSSGKVESSYFSKQGYVTIGDKYVDPASIERQNQLAKKKKIPHENEFRPADGSKTDPFGVLYKHMTDHVAVKKNYRGPDGKVVVPPKNITTNPPKVGHGDSTVGHLISKLPPHIADPYNRKRELEAKERQEHNKKLQEAPFRSVSHGNNLFVNTKQTFGKDGKILPPTNPKARTPEGKLHENPFKPSNPPKEGYNKTINKFPDYKPDPIRVAVRKPEDPTKKDPYRPNNTAFDERPTPSISLNAINLKNEMSRISGLY